MVSLREKYESYNDDIHLDATCDREYYAGKVNATIEIDKLLDKCKDEGELVGEITKLKQASEASRDSGVDGEAWAYYDGEVAGYREVLDIITDIIREEKDYEETSAWNDKERRLNESQRS